MNLWCQNSIPGRCKISLGKLFAVTFRTTSPAVLGKTFLAAFFFCCHSCVWRNRSEYSYNWIISSAGSASSGGPWAANKYKLQSSCLFMLTSSFTAAFRCEWNLFAKEDLKASNFVWFLWMPFMVLDFRIRRKILLRFLTDVEFLAQVS